MRLTCVVDNAVAHGVELWGEHGLSFLVESTGGRVLLDAGSSGAVLAHNLHVLSSEPESLDAIVLSHAHRDHSGGLSALMGRVRGLSLYGHEDLFQPRFRKADGECRPIGIPWGPERMAEWFDVRLSREPRQVVPGVWTTGEIGERAAPMGRSARHFVRMGGRYVPDPYRDDQALVLETGAGLVVVCGCCHAGLLNTLRHVLRTFGRPIQAVMGGAHLVDASEAHLEEVVAFLQGLSPMGLWLNHCTGEQALFRLVQSFGSQVHPCPAGTQVEFP